MKKTLLVAFLFLLTHTQTMAAEEKAKKPQSVPSQVSKTFLPVVQDGKWGYIDETGKIVIPLQFDKADAFREGLAAIKLGHQVGYIDETGKIVINPQFDDAWAFDNGIAPVRQKGKLGYINKAGEFIWKPAS